MSADQIDGRELAARRRAIVAAEAADLRRSGVTPRLAAVLVGQDPAALSYAQSQARSCESVNIDYSLITLETTCSTDNLYHRLDEAGASADVHGLMMHLPLPDGLDAFAAQQRIPPAKDVEGVGAANLGMLAMGRPALAPCTAAAALLCLQSVMPDLAGKHVVVVGRSAIVGKPLAMLLLGQNATVTQCHSRTRNLADHTRRADALVVAAGSAGLIGAEHVTPDMVVIDVGTNRVLATGADRTKTERLVGDVRYDEVASIVRAITPVPGGVGPVTVALLLANTVAACRRQTGR